ncbi:MAG: hypothetical protein JXA71_09015 [Chitinispirillaceae bacterium]|nr:hypothetical protein [Chitinispirillaceae bacterium]
MAASPEGLIRQFALLRKDNTRTASVSIESITFLISHLKKTQDKLSELAGVMLGLAPKVPAGVTHPVRGRQWLSE